MNLIKFDNTYTGIYKSEQRFMPSRAYIRGYYDIERDLMQFKYSHSGVTAVCELGIGGGGRLEDWCEIFPEARVVGVEKSNIGTEYKPGKLIVETSVNPRLQFIHGVDAYLEESPSIVFEKTKIEQYDIIIDDADPSPNEERKYIVERWSKYLANDGILMSETICGQDQDIDNPPKDRWNDVFEWHAKLGMIIFDLEPYAHLNADVNATMKNNRTNTFLAVWVQDKELYRPVLEKYADCIIAGTL